MTYDLKEAMAAREARPWWIKLVDNLTRPSWWYYRLIDRPERWIRAHITQRAHWLKLQDKATCYMDPDHKIELAVLAIVNEYLEEELGPDTAENRQKWGEDDIWYRGYRVHFVGGHQWIDVCLAYRHAYQAYVDHERSDEPSTKVYFEREEHLRDQVTSTMIDVVKYRGALWT